MKITDVNFKDCFTKAFNEWAMDAKKQLFSEMELRKIAKIRSIKNKINEVTHDPLQSKNN